ncbi:MAG: TIR domain-containing protein, partial [Sphingomonas bacterium]|nr:TIR domain-containing protein [Sphingomonas bacterium]
TIFLSYAHADGKRAQQLAAALTARGYTVWWDTLIEGGASFAKSIREALEAADAVVVLWSKTSIESDWVADEAAQGRDRKRLVPLSLDGSLPPLGFRQYQTIDLSGWRGKGASAQVDSIDRAIGTAIGGTPGVQRVAQASTVDRRSALLIAGGAGVALAGGGALYAWRDDWFGPGAGERTIAVLPFKNLSGDTAQAYLSDGLTEEVRAALTRNAGLQVLAATTSNTARDHSEGATAIAGKLGVAHLLEGSVQRAGDVVRVAIELTDGKTGFSTWAKRIDARLTDIFAFQTEIARTVSEALSVRMATQDPAPGGTRNVAAYEAYLRGKALYNLSKDEKTDRQAKALYENAIAADPDFGLAHAALSRVLSSIASAYAPASEIKALYAAAISEGRRSVSLAPKLAEAHLALGYALFAGRLDVKGARSSYDLAYRYGRGNADILLLYALYTVRARRFAEAGSAIDRAVALDPLNPRSHRAAGSIGYAARDYDKAIGHLHRALELNPEMRNAYGVMGNCLIAKNRLAEARTALEAEKSAMLRLTGLAVVEHRSGNRAAAQRAYDDLVREVGDAALYQQAEVMAQWGRPDEAMNLLRRARDVGDSGLTLVASDPLLDPIAKDPRFLAFVREIGFA